jgi:hypothetical protein
MGESAKGRMEEFSESVSLAAENAECAEVHLQHFRSGGLFQIIEKDARST